MRIRFDHPASARMSFRPGDELTVSVMTPEIDTFLNQARADGLKVARVVSEDDEEVADVDRSDAEVAVMGRRGRHAQRPEALASK